MVEKKKKNETPTDTATVSQELFKPGAQDVIAQAEKSVAAFKTAEKSLNAIAQAEKSVAAFKTAGELIAEVNKMAASNTMRTAGELIGEAQMAATNMGIRPNAEIAGEFDKIAANIRARHPEIPPALDMAAATVAAFLRSAPPLIQAISDLERLRTAALLAQRDYVALARHQGMTWAEIGDELGITRQAAQQRFGG